MNAETIFFQPVNSSRATGINKINIP